MVVCAFINYFIHTYVTETLMDALQVLWVKQ